MNWNVNTLVPLLAVILYGAVIFVVARARPLTQSRRAFLIYLIAMLLWSLGSFLVHSEIGDTLIFFRLMSTVGLTSIITLFHFVQNVTNRRRRWADWVYFYILIAIAASLFSPLVFPSASIVNGELSYKFGPLVWIFAPPIYGLYFFSLYELYQAYKVAEDPTQRNRIRYLMLGLGLVIVAASINFTPLGRFPIDIAANGINALIIAYAIIRHELLDIQIVIRKSLAYATLVLALALTYLVPILILELAALKFSTGLSLSGILLALGVGVFIAATVHWIYEGLRDRIDRIYFRERYDAYRMIQELSERMASSLDLDLMTSTLMNRLDDTLHIKTIVIMLKQPATNEFRIAASKGFRRESTFLSWGRNHPICRWLRQEGKVLTKRQIDIIPLLSGVWKRDQDELEELGAEILVPLRAKGDLVGILFLGEKQSGEEYDMEDQVLLSTLASQVAVALENARLFQETNTRLAEQIAIFEVGESLARVFNLDDILQLVVNHACSTNAAASNAVIHLVDHEMKRLIPRAVSRTDGEPAYAVGFGMDQGIIGRALQKRQQVYLPDVHEAPDFVDTGEEFRSLVVIPLIVEDIPEGALSVTSPVANAFDADALRQLASLGNQAAVAVRKAQITERLRSSLTELEERSKELESSLIQLQSAQKQLVQAGKLASLGTLSAGIAHELNNPLAGIKLFAQNLLRYQSSGKLTPEKLGESLKKIDALVDKAADIIEHLRAFSRQSSGKLEPLLVNQPVEDALSMLSEQLRLRNIQLTVELESKLPPVLGDANQLEQVMVNLIANARDAVEQSEEKKIRLRTFNTDSYVVIEIVDSGCGISPEDLDKIFDPFFTTKAVGEGTGLGLSISHGIVEYHGGNIEVESVINEGTTFRIKLPVSQG